MPARVATQPPVGEDLGQLRRRRAPCGRARASASGETGRADITIPSYDNAGDGPEMPRRTRALSSPGRMKRRISTPLRVPVRRLRQPLSAQTDAHDDDRAGGCPLSDHSTQRPRQRGQDPGRPGRCRLVPASPRPTASPGSRTASCGNGRSGRPASSARTRSTSSSTASTSGSSKAARARSPPERAPIARLDTVSGELTEYVIPGTIPAAFYRAPDGTVWLPQSAVRAAAGLNLRRRSRSPNYRSLGTFAYADMVVGPDGAFWLADFGNNRIVRYVPGATTETSWTFLDPSQGLLQPSQIQFDDQGFLWIAERTGQPRGPFRPDEQHPLQLREHHRADPLRHLRGPRVHHVDQHDVTDHGARSQPGDRSTWPPMIVPLTLSVGTTPATIPVTIRESNIPPVDVPSAPAPIDPSTFTVVNPSASGLGGILTTTFPASNTYGIMVDGGHVWAGTDGNLAELNMQAIGDALGRLGAGGHEHRGVDADRPHHFQPRGGIAARLGASTCTPRPRSPPATASRWPRAPRASSATPSATSPRPPRR